MSNRPKSLKQLDPAATMGIARTVEVEVWFKNLEKVGPDVGRYVSWPMAQRMNLNWEPDLVSWGPAAWKLPRNPASCIVVAPTSKPEAWTLEERGGVWDRDEGRFLEWDEIEELWPHPSPEAEDAR